MFKAQHTSHPSSSSSTTPTSKTYIDFFYTSPPKFELSLAEFEEYALARLVVLRKIEEMKIKNLDKSEYDKKMKAILTLNLPTGTDDLSKLKARRKDQASHFILRMAYCRTEDLRRWFLIQETLLFKYRLAEVETQGVDMFSEFLSAANLTFTPVGGGEKSNLRDMLSFNMSPGEFSSSTFYKIPFIQACELLSSRKVYVQNGLCYVPSSSLSSIVSSKYRSSISKSLIDASRVYTVVTADGRIGPLINNMNKQYTGAQSFSSSGSSELNSGSIEAVSKRSMPLCMKMAQRGLKADSKLKHWGRLQYGLFLKAGGLSMEEALVFFESIFTKIMTVDQFAKNYAYNIRHMYGKEGKRSNYTAYSCTKIIMGNPPMKGEYHGCPFRHYDDSSLDALLGNLGITGSDKSAIMAHKKTNQPQLACAKHFELTHPGVEKMAGEGVGVEGVGNHPNGWLESSLGYWGVKEGRGKVKREKGVKSENNGEESSLESSLEKKEKVDLAMDEGIE